jgi:hypothetical protein
LRRTRIRWAVQSTFHPAKCKQLALPHAGHRRREVQDAVDPAKRVGRPELVQVETVEVDRRRLGDPELRADRPPRHAFAVAQAQHAPRSLRRPGLPPAAGTGRRSQQGVELGLIEEADVLVLVGDHGLLDGLARVSGDPSFAEREVEDAVQEAEVVARALDRLVVLEAGRDELLDVVLADLGDRLLAEEGPDVHAEIALIADRGRRLAAPGDEMLDQPLPRLRDGHPLVDRRDSDLGHQLSQPGFGHLPGQAVAAAGSADRPELSRDRPVPDTPLAVPGVALLEDAAGAVPALGAA